MATCNCIQGGDIVAKAEEVDELAEVIEQFMAEVDGEDDRPWSSVGMAEAIMKAGYRKPTLQNGKGEKNGNGTRGERF
jgi:hypothetical protein